MTLLQLQTAVQVRLNEDPSRVTPTYYPAANVTVALNEGQALFVLLSLCQETTATMPLAANTAFYHMLTVFADYLVPLRVRISGTGGAKVSPARLQDLDALDLGWQSDNSGPPANYAALGFDFFAVHPQPSAAGTSLDVTYAQAAPALVLATDVPVIPAEYHPALVDYAIPWLRAAEGGKEFQASLSYFDRYLDAAQKMGEYIRARNIAQGYDRLPFELKSFDRSELIAKMAKPADKAVA
jgi:hypothetical protein